jgi:IPT/TIG domain/FG-GAP repeat
MSAFKALRGMGVAAPRVAGRTAAVSIPGGAALTAPGSHKLRPSRIPALLVGAALACIATLALATLPAPPAPSSHPLGSRHGLQSHLATRLPIGLAPTASASIGASERGFWQVRHGASLLTRGGGIHSTFTASGAALRVAQGTLGLSLTGVGRGQRVERVATVAPSGARSQVLYRHGSISEFYRNGPYGLEQGFTLLRRPQAGTGSLVLALGLRGTLIPEQVGSQILFRTHAGATALRYGQLSARDATGRGLPTHMQVRNGTLQLRIDDSGARYPLRIDPFIQRGSKLTGSGEIGQGSFGESVALSSDGNTALIGGPFDNSEVGAAWVFTRSGSTWTQQGSKLTGSGETGKGEFGFSVALSSDGNTALIGGPRDNSEVGAAWVFTRPGSTWTQQGSKLTGSGGIGRVWFGWSVALSGDGNTALIGGPEDNSEVGAAWVFTRSGSTWTQQGSKLTGSGETVGGQFGWSVALSGDGNTALIGGRIDNTYVGAAWVFTRPGSTWTQQGSKLTGSGEIGKAEFGVSVALSGDGNTALIGGPYDNNVGAAWVFTRSGSTWTQQGSKLTGSGEIGKGEFGWSVALSGDGNTALIGGYSDNSFLGAAWVFTRSGSTWTQQGSKLTGSGETVFPVGGYFGSSVALSGDGNTALIGGPVDNSFVGAAWVFTPTPTITNVNPYGGPEAGGTSVTITGTHFTGVTAVKFGSTSATSFTVNSASSITAVSPAGTGTVDVTVTTPEGTSATSAADQFSYPPTVTNVNPNAGPEAGGTSVTITGTNFTGATAVHFGEAAATEVTVKSATEITVKSPAHEAGTVCVTVINPGGASAASSGCQFSYVPPPPIVTNVNPYGGPEAGGTSVTITGTDFTGVTAVKFGSTGATSFTVNSASSVTAVSPAGSGTVDVTVTTPVGASSASSADRFSYVPPPPPAGGTPPPAGGASCNFEAGFSFIDARGCFHNESGRFVSAPGSVVQMNGLTITPVPTAWMVFDPSNRTVVSGGTGGVTVSAGNVPIHQGDLSWKVPDETGHTKVPLDELSPPSGAMVAGLKLTGHMAVQITDTRGTELDGRVTLPFGFESVGSAAVHLETTVQDGLKSDAIRAEEKNLLLGPLEVKDLFLQYSPIEDIWKGGVKVVLPTPNNYEVAATMAFQHGGFKSASGEIDNLNFQLVDGIFLQRIALSVEVNPLQLGGGLGVTAGPQIEGKAAVRVDGNFFYRFATATPPNPGKLHLDGTLQLAGFQVASAYFDYLTTGSVDFGGELHLGLPEPSAETPSEQPVYIEAFLTGWVDGPRAFDVEVGANVKIAGLFSVHADLLASNIGMAACGQVWFLKGGFGYYWATHELDIMGGSCDVGPWRPPRPAGLAAVGDRTLTLPPGGALLKLTGVSASPLVTLHGPAGQTVSVPLDPRKPIGNDRFVVFQVPSMKATYIAIHRSAGRWTITPAPGSSTISDLEVAGVLPAPQVKARVTGHGRRRTLTWTLRPAAGQQVLFAEVGPQTHRKLALVSARHGSVQFTPGDGKGGPRSIIALVENHGLPRAQFTVARYTAPPPLRAGRPGRLRGRRLPGGRLRLSWAAAKNADGYVIRVRLGDGAEIVQFAERRSRSVVISDVVPIDAATVSVTGRRASGSIGPPATARFVFTRKRTAHRHHGGGGGR